MFDKKVIDEIEDVFTNELGEGSSFILDRNLYELGLSRETFKRTDINDFVDHLLTEYNKVIRDHSDKIKTEIKKRFDD